MFYIHVVYSTFLSFMWPVYFYATSLTVQYLLLFDCMGGMSLTLVTVRYFGETGNDGFQVFVACIL